MKQYDAEKFYEEYSVLASDKGVKHGQYVLFHKTILDETYLKVVGNYNHGKKDGMWTYYFEFPMNQISERGQYKNDVKDGQWITYFPEVKNAELEVDRVTQSVKINNSNALIRSKEYFSLGKPVDIWEFYSVEKKLVQVFDFGKDSLLYDSSLQVPGNTLDHSAIFLGGDFRMKQLLNMTFDFEELMKGTYMRNLKSGILTIELAIDQQGRMHTRTLESTIKNKKVIERAFLALESLQGYWIEGRRAGMPISTLRVVTFTINREVTYTPGNVNHSGIIWISFKIDI